MSVPPSPRPRSVSAASYDSLPSSVSASSATSRSSASVARMRLTSFIAAVLTALCAGSITVFSLYGHIFQERLHYTQLQVNGVAIGSSVALYLPVSVLGFVCDRYGSVPLSLLASVLFGAGYTLAAAVYRFVDAAVADIAARGSPDDEPPAWSYGLMVFAFVCIGVATCAMYLSAVATCAKNFGKGRHRGMALSSPIAGFGLSGIWLSQVASHFFSTPPAHGRPGPAELDVYRYFLFLAGLLFAVGIAGAFVLRVVDEDDIIDEAAEELERSGLLEPPSASGTGTYGSFRDPEADEAIIAPRTKKEWVLNAETRSFLQDRTMWFFALGFLLIIGPGEAFLNNLGTVISSLNSVGTTLSVRPTTPATHVSIVSITSTVARLLTGSLTDLLAPSPTAQHMQLDGSVALASPARRFCVSRVVFLLTFAGLLSVGLLTLASGVVQDHGERFWVVSSLIGAGYGAVFSLTPIVITIIWGVENFATNWGIVAMLPALGSTFWGLVYSAVYQAGAEKTPTLDGEKAIFCYGTQCYAPTFWGMTVTVWVACGMIVMAWKGRGGWVDRGIVI
ncbi:hypothetical protein TD95_001647 [Thielaviopsis punctulata]|uniref:Probable transporter MCH1 n=1 Tax=Thielaviopsis punctulata TaxID=72032 RepID=A0A0F4Z8J4_9PEZI|nr:hypothetical protein TD95_001647 [Thielaviopsis punctulata]